jgi:integration host factor subunit beta
MTTKRQLVNLLATKNTQLSPKQIITIVDTIINFLTKVLVKGQRVEIRGFGAFSIRKRTVKILRNPKTNQVLPPASLYRVYYRPSKNIF